jgi:hypothetical protein
MKLKTDLEEMENNFGEDQHDTLSRLKARRWRERSVVSILYLVPWNLQGTWSERRHRPSVELETPSALFCKWHTWAYEVCLRKAVEWEAEESLQQFNHVPCQNF